MYVCMYVCMYDGHNTYAIEMLINVIQNEVFLSEAEAYQCT